MPQKKQSEKIQEILEEVLDKNTDLDSMRLSYITEHYPNLFGLSLDEIYKKVENDKKMKDALEIIDIMSKNTNNILIKLNHLLKYQDRNVKVLKIEDEIKKIQAKENISVKEFTEKYGLGKTSQQNYRMRKDDPLPFHQITFGGKISYNVEEVEKWFQNQHK
jgi:predicted transcriptional regulator with HTH domain